MITASARPLVPVVLLAAACADRTEHGHSGIVETLPAPPGDTGPTLEDTGIGCPFGSSGDSADSAGFAAAFYVDVEGLFEAVYASDYAYLGYPVTFGPFRGNGSIILWCVPPGPLQLVAYDATETWCNASTPVDLGPGEELDWDVYDLPGAFDPSTFTCTLP